MRILRPLLLFFLILVPAFAQHGGGAHGTVAARGGGYGGGWSAGGYRGGYRGSYGFRGYGYYGHAFYGPRYYGSGFYGYWGWPYWGAAFAYPYLYYGWPYGYYARPYPYGYAPYFAAYTSPHPSGDAVPVSSGYSTSASVVSTIPQAQSAQPFYRKADVYLIAFNNHMIQRALRWRIEGDQIVWTSQEHQQMRAPLSTVDQRFTEQINRDRRVEVQMPNTLQ